MAIIMIIAIIISANGFVEIALQLWIIIIVTIITREGGGLRTPTRETQVGQVELRNDTAAPATAAAAERIFRSCQSNGRCRGFYVVMG
jgi:hypothetical protein